MPHVIQAWTVPNISDIVDDITSADVGKVARTLNGFYLLADVFDEEGNSTGWEWRKIPLEGDGGGSRTVVRFVDMPLLTGGLWGTTVYLLRLDPGSETPQPTEAADTIVLTIDQAVYDADGQQPPEQITVRGIQAPTTATEMRLEVVNHTASRLLFRIEHSSVDPANRIAANADYDYSFTVPPRRGMVTFAYKAGVDDVPGRWQILSAGGADAISLRGAPLDAQQPAEGDVLTFATDFDLPRWVPAQVAVPKWTFNIDSDTSGDDSDVNDIYVGNWHCNTQGVEGTIAQGPDYYGLVVTPIPGKATAFDATSFTPFVIEWGASVWDPPRKLEPSLAYLAFFSLLSLRGGAPLEEGDFAGLHIGYHGDAGPDATFKDDQLLLQWGRPVGSAEPGLRVVVGTSTAFIPAAELPAGAPDGFTFALYTHGAEVSVWIVNGMPAQYELQPENVMYRVKLLGQLCFSGLRAPSLRKHGATALRLGLHAVHNDTGFTTTFSRIGLYSLGGA